MINYDKKIRNSVIALVSAVVTFGITLTVSYFAIYGAQGVTILGNKIKKAAEYANASADAASMCEATVFLGDSITEMCDLDKYYPTLDTCNRGICGDTTDGMLERLQSNVLALKPTKLVFLGGTNDLGKGIPPQEIANTIQSIIQKTQENLPSCKIFVQSIYPVNTVRKPTFFSKTGCRNNETIDELNLLLQEICNKRNCVYIDVNAQLKDAHGNLKKEYTVDGLHLTKVGYEKASSIIAPYII